jgi:membrane-bound lytic murein transglycosylase D
MKAIQSKILLALIIVFFIVGFTTSAKSLIGFPEHPEKTPSTVTELPVATNPLAVVYPESLEEHRLQTKNYIKSFSKKEREYIIYIFSKGKKFFPKAANVLDKYNVPMELQMIPVLESDFNANAVSPAGAVGYWQFMPELANEYGLNTRGKYDERKNFTKSTIAAAKFFRDQLDFFNDNLLLSVAAYNCGQGRVRASLARSKKENACYWDIKKFLPSETRKFVMNFIALNVIYANYEKFLNKELNFNEPPVIKVAPADSIKSNDSLCVTTL